MVGLDPLESLCLFVVGQEACGGDIVVEFPVDERGGDDGDEADEEEDAAA